MFQTRIENLSPGQRVVLAEKLQALQSPNNVQSAGDRLVAHVVFSEGKTATSEELRAHLSASLPPQMVPNEFHTLSQMPQTRNGKIDRRALSMMRPAEEQYTQTHVAPRSRIEAGLAEIWQELLGLKQVGIQDNFFNLGGHSLQAIRLASRIQDKFGFEVSVRDVFEAPTIARFTQRMNQTEDTADCHVEMLRAGSTKPVLFCAVGAGSVAGYFSPLAENMSPEQPFYGLKNPDFDEEGVKEQSVEELAELYVSSIRKIAPKGPYYLGGWSFGGVIAYEMAQQLVRAGETISLLAILDTTLPGKQENLPPSFPDRMLKIVSRIPRELRVLRYAWPLIIGYGRDAAGLIFNGIRGRRNPSKSDVTPREYLAWMWFDLHRQAALSAAGAAVHKVSDRRLAMIEEPNVRHILSVLKDKGNAMLKYEADPYPGHITLICGEDSVDTADSTMGWGAVASEGVTTHLVPGNHNSFLLNPDVKEVARMLQSCIDKAQDDGV
jgi:thioesterase domain-containing protein/acyl carrier protein